MSNCFFFPQKENGESLGSGVPLDFVKAFYYLDELSRKSGQEEVPVASIIPSFQDFLGKELNTEKVEFGEAYQIYEHVVSLFGELKKKLSDKS